MKRVCAPCVPALCLPTLCILLGAALPAQQPGESTELPSRPFQIKSTWVIGGVGNWDYLTAYPRAERLYIAHGHAVQVVDVKSGSLVGEIAGLADAHSVVLDDTGEFGYVSDGRGAKVVVFNRGSLQTTATIADVPSPRALVFEPQTRLLFAVRNNPAPAPPAQPRRPRTAPRPNVKPEPQSDPLPDSNASSSVTVIDTQTLKIIGQILLDGSLGFARADSRGQVFINVTDRNQILRFDAQSVADLLHKKPDDGAAHPDPAPQPQPAADAKAPLPGITVDWTQGHRSGNVRTFSIAPGCINPKSLAIDNAHQRLFAACGNLQLLVLNADTGERVASLPIGSGVEAIGYDPGRGLIFAANGGADGSLTIIHQDVTDTYRVIQTLPTRQRARTLAVNADTGQVYLVTDLLGVDLTPSAGTGPVRTDPVNGSFQVLVVSN
jgi:DNA-binding beta-propeller fold protein YncE